MRLSKSETIRIDILLNTSLILIFLLSVCVCVCGEELGVDHWENTRITRRVGGFNFA